MNSRSSAKSVAKLPPRQVEKIKEAILGKDYELSLVFCGDTVSRRLNLTYRGKDKPANVLSFPLTKTSGEIFINEKRKGEFSVLFLFIHGLLHLKGMQHGARMESEEQKFFKLFNGASLSSRNRHRKPAGKSSNR